MGSIRITLAGLMTYIALVIAVVSSMPCSEVIAAGLANLSLQPGAQNVKAGDTLDVSIQVVADKEQVVGVDIYLDFDPSVLEVVDADDTTEGIQITSGSSFSTIIVNNANNATGQISYSAGKLGAPYPNGTFTVATIKFQTLTTIPGATRVNFSASNPRTTVVSNQLGQDITGALSDGSYEILGMQSSAGLGWWIGGAVTGSFLVAGALILIYRERKNEKHLRGTGLR